jgi:hypothetical protein
MKNAAISSLLQFRPRYMRSTNVERDIDDRKVRIPTIATTHSDGSRPPVPIDRDQCGAGADGAVG